MIDSDRFRAVTRTSSIALEEVSVSSAKAKGVIPKAKLIAVESGEIFHLDLWMLIFLFSLADLTLESYTNGLLKTPKSQYESF